MNGDNRASGQPSSEGHVATRRKPGSASTKTTAGQPSSEGHVATLGLRPCTRGSRDLVNLPQKVTSRHDNKAVVLDAEEFWSTFLRRSRRDTGCHIRRGQRQHGLVNLPQKVTSRHVRQAVVVPVEVRPGQPSSEGHVATQPAQPSPDDPAAGLVNLPQKVTSRHPMRLPTPSRSRSGQPSSEGHVATRSGTRRRARTCRPLVNLPQKVTSRHCGSNRVISGLPTWSTFLRRSRRDTGYAGLDLGVTGDWSTFLRRSRRDTRPGRTP